MLEDAFGHVRGLFSASTDGGGTALFA